jgi:excisionase family DNA binding protein
LSGSRLSSPRRGVADERSRSERRPTSPTVSLDPVYLKPDQVGELLQIKVKTVYDWASKDPTMPVIRIGHTLRFHRERLLKWLADREQGRPRLRRVRTSKTAAAAEPALENIAARHAEGDPPR